MAREAVGRQDWAHLHFEEVRVGGYGRGGRKRGYQCSTDSNGHTHLELQYPQSRLILDCIELRAWREPEPSRPPGAGDPGHVLRPYLGLSRVCPASAFTVSAMLKCELIN